MRPRSAVAARRVAGGAPSRWAASDDEIDPTAFVGDECRAVTGIERDAARFPAGPDGGDDRERLPIERHDATREHQADVQEGAVGGRGQADGGRAEMDAGDAAPAAQVNGVQPTLLVRRVPHDTVPRNDEFLRPPYDLEGPDGVHRSRT